MIYVKAGIINVDVIATDGAEECVWGAKGNVGSKGECLSLKQSMSHFSPRVQTESKKQIGRKWRSEHLMKRRNINLHMRQLYSQR